MATPECLPRGEFYSSVRDGGYYIDRADPRILITDKIIADAANGLLRPVATLEGSGHELDHLGALLKIRATNRQVVYRLAEWIPDLRCYVGEWPE